MIRFGKIWKLKLLFRSHGTSLELSGAVTFLTSVLVGQVKNLLHILHHFCIITRRELLGLGGSGHVRCSHGHNKREEGSCACYLLVPLS